MSVHRFLTNIDVVYAVFGHLDLFPRPITDSKDCLTHEAFLARRTLANAALTCRAFSEPALKTLWTCIHPGPFLPLRKTFSCLTLKESDSPDWELERKRIVYGVGREFSALEWEQFDRLASWVRYLDFRGATLEPSVVDALVKRCQTKGAALLPNLRVLHWSESLGDAHELQLLRALCSAPSLSLVCIGNRQYTYSDNLAQDLAVITEARPNLAHFSFSGYLYLQSNSPIRSMRSLKSLELAEVDEASFCLIGTFPYLTDLSTTLIDVHNADSPPVNVARTPSQGDPSFPTLRRLRTSGAPATLIWMITQISSPDLTSLSVKTHAKDIADMLPPFETIFALPAAHSLQQLHLVIDLDDEAGGRMEVAFADFAHSILPLRHLEDVRLCVRPRMLSFSDADIALIKSAWPRLRRLSLSFDASKAVQDAWGPIPRPSIIALVDLALARPQLETLDVEVASITEDDLNQLEGISTGAPGDKHRRVLTWLTLARNYYREHITFPSDVPRLARALHRLFPMVGGLGRPIEEAEEGFVRYYSWSKLDMGHDVFRVLDQLEKLKSQPCRHTFWELGAVLI
ncbi:hypothetical protein C8Q74DRAFT_192233 [Fomes fomentarius]|nr:hypothetical protein C8Q74DRAFT_192233 [Fomes fomentarius]